MYKWISWSQSGTLAVDPEAQRVLRQVKRPVVISAVGFARIGKSFLMNQLCGRDCFVVSPGVSICTRGLSFAVEGNTVYVDTEGLAGMAGGPDHDAKLFLLAFLLSSVVIYCSKGVIDEPSLNQLSFVTQLTTSLQTENKPGLVWLLKDFALDLRALSGEQMSSNEYLRRALEGDTPLRQLIRETFPDRDCVTLVRPCQEESDMYNIQDENLRAEYKSGLVALRKSLAVFSKPRELKGTPLTGAMLCELTERIVQTLNARELPQLGTVWDNISQNRCEEGKEAALKFINAAVKKAQNTLPVNEEELQNGFKSVKQEAVRLFKEIAMGEQVAEFENALRVEIKARCSEVGVRNYEISRVYCTDTLRRLYKEFIEMLDFHSAEELAQAWTEIKNEYDIKCRGPAKATVWNLHATDHILQTMKLLAYKMETKHRLDMFKVKSQLQVTTLELTQSRKVDKPPEDNETQQKPPSCQECVQW